jgi:ATP-dependent exoDNAse (exonuclease V) beta subunit
MIPFNWEDRKRVNNIWVDTSKLFNQKLPAALVSSNKNLENSYFKSEYNNEKEMSLLDSYNKLYVAMTRAKERLYVYSKSFPDKIKDDFCIKGDLNSFLYAYDTKYPVIIGDKDMIHLCEPINKRIFSVEQRKKLDWKEVISLKHSAEEIWDINDINAKRDWGKLLHLALSQIHYSNQKNEVIDMMYRSGVCVEDDYEKLKETITKLFAHKEVKPLFDDEWDIKTEKEILTKEGRTYIPDRLMFSKKSNEIVIVDYKTAIDKEKFRLKHETQINEYADVLKMMGKTNIRKVLIYTSDPILVI